MLGYKKHGKGVVFQGEARTMPAAFRVLKATKKKKKKEYVFKANKKYQIRVCFTTQDKGMILNSYH